MYSGNIMVTNIQMIHCMTNTEQKTQMAIYVKVHNGYYIMCRHKL